MTKTTTSKEEIEARKKKFQEAEKKKRQAEKDLAAVEEEFHQARKEYEGAIESAEIEKKTRDRNKAIGERISALDKEITCLRNNLLHFYNIMEGIEEPSAATIERIAKDNGRRGAPRANRREVILWTRNKIQSVTRRIGEKEAEAETTRRFKAAIEAGELESSPSPEHTSLKSRRANPGRKGYPNISGCGGAIIIDKKDDPRFKKY